MTGPKINSFYRARLNCKLGRDVIEGKTETPVNITRMEYALLFMFRALEEITDGLENRKESKCRE